MVSDSNSWTGNVWYHVAGVIDPVDGMSLYIDGVKQNDMDTSVLPASNLIHATHIGKWGGLSSRYFNGRIDEVRIWDRSLSQNEILDNQCDTINPLTTRSNWILAL